VHVLHPVKVYQGRFIAVKLKLIKSWLCNDIAEKAV